MFSAFKLTTWPQRMSGMPCRIEIQQPHRGDDIQPPCASLLGIPGELRKGIYDQLFPDIDKDISRLQVLLCCRQIYHEAAIQAFKLRRFVIHGKDKELADRLSFLSQEQKDMIKIIERPGPSQHSLLLRPFYLAIEKHLRPSCLLLGIDEATQLLSAIVRIQSLAHVFAYSREGHSIARLHKWHWEMMQYNHSSVVPFKNSHENISFSLGTNADCILIGQLQSSSFVVRVVSGVQHRDITIKVPRYSLSDFNGGKWEYHMDGISTWLPAR